MRILMALLLLAAVGLAETGPGLAIAPWFGNAENELEFEIESFLKGNTSDGASYRQTRYFFGGRSRLSERSNLGYDALYYKIDTDDPRLSSQLGTFTVAGTYDFGESGSWNFYGLLGLGTSSDEPFIDGNSWYLRADFTAELKVNEKSSWLFVLFYDGNRAILPDVPLPSVVYRWFPERNLRFFFGFPFVSGTWEPGNWELEAQFLAVALDARARVAYKLNRGMKLYAQLESRTEAFFTAEGGNSDRIFYRQRYAELGLEVSPGRWGTIQIAGGYGFSRRFWRGRDIRDDEDNRVDLSDEGYVRVGLTVRF